MSNKRQRRLWRYKQQQTLNQTFTPCILPYLATASPVIAPMHTPMCTSVFII